MCNLWDKSSPNGQLLVKVTKERTQTFMYPYTDLLCKPLQDTWTGINLTEQGILQCLIVHMIYCVLEHWFVKCYMFCLGNLLYKFMHPDT